MSSQNTSVLILGARSDMALAIAHEFARSGASIQLAARKSKTLSAELEDLKLRYNVEVTLHEFDILKADQSFVDGLPELPAVVVCAVGAMGEQAQNEQDMTAQSEVLRVNFEAPARVLSLFANAFEARGSGTIVGISSVAGERGRATNYVYGSAKAGFTAFLSGLRNRLAKKGVHVLTVLPGFVATKMTEGMDLPEKLTAEPKEVGEAVVKAVQKGRNVIYVRPIWMLIMAIIRNIPEMVFKKLSL